MTNLVRALLLTQNQNILFLQIVTLVLILENIYLIIWLQPVLITYNHFAPNNSMLWTQLVFFGKFIYQLFS